MGILFVRDMIKITLLGGIIFYIRDCGGKSQ